MLAPTPLTPDQETKLTTLAADEACTSAAEGLRGLISENRRAREHHADMRWLMGELREAFAAEPVHRLTDKQRFRVLHPTVVDLDTAQRKTVRIEASAPLRHPGRPWWRPVVAAAAGVALLAIVLDRSGLPGGGSRGWTGDNTVVVHRVTRPAEMAAHLPDPDATLAALLYHEESRPVAAPPASSFTAKLDPPTIRPLAPPLAVPPSDPPALAHADLPPIPRPPDFSLRPSHSRIALLRETALLRSGGARAWTAAARNAPALTATPFLDASRQSALSVPLAVTAESFDLVRQCARDFGLLPPPGIVRVEEIVNQLDYADAEASESPLRISLDRFICPWNEQHELIRVTLAARPVTVASQPPLHFSFLVRVADSPENDRAQLLFWQGLTRLAAELRPTDTLSIAVHGQAQGLVLPPTPASDITAIESALARIHSGGMPGTSAASPPREAVSRVVLVTDGPLDFPAPVIGALSVVASDIRLLQLGPQRDKKPPELDCPLTRVLHADSGAEARRLFARDLVAPAAPVAEGLALDVTVSPEHIHSYRLLGFATPESGATTGTPARLFAGQQATVVFEAVPLQAVLSGAEPAPNRFERLANQLLNPGTSRDVVSAKVRFRSPGDRTPAEIATRLNRPADDWRRTSAENRLAAAAAGLGLWLRGGPDFPLSMRSDLMLKLAEPALKRDPYGVRAEFISLAGTVSDLQ